MDQREKDKFERISLHERIEKARMVIDHYLEGMAFYHKEIAKYNYIIGRIDQRLGD
jgi:hypothetical protein